MAVREWLRPPRHLLVLFVGITLILAATLGWLGWRLLQQDRALESQRVRERLENAASTVAVELERQLARTEATLVRLAALAPARLRVEGADWARGLPDGTVLLVLDAGTLESHPYGQLVFTPVPPASPEPPAGTFAEGEWLEFRTRDYRAAAQAYDALARSTDRRVRPGALLRLGRAFRKDGKLQPALGAYRRLADLDSIWVEGLPAGLLGRHAGATVLESLDRVDEARAEARALYSDLLAARWPIGRGAFEFYLEDVVRQMGSARGDEVRASRTALAQVADAVWSDWSARSAPARAGSGRRMLRSGDAGALVIWAGTAERRLALVVGADAIEGGWLPALEPIVNRERVRVALDDAEGNPVVSQLPGDATPQVVRTAAETHLPWTLRVASADPGGLTAEFAARRRLMLAGLVVATLLVLFGTYAVARAVTRELEVARLRSDFVAAVSHEFRTPLTSMRQLTELLASGRVPTEERRGRYYQVLQREGERLHRLVEGLLDFGRMEAGALEFRPEPLDAESLVRAVVNEFRAEVSQRGYSVEVRTDGAVGTVRGDREALTRALWNLLDNAVKYSPEQHTIHVTVGQENGRVSISVQDQGVGIAPEEQGRIFEKFVRGSSADVATVKGTGIGLTMVRHIVKAHGGEIRLASRPGSGSTFTILLSAEA